MSSGSLGLQVLGSAAAAGVSPPAATFCTTSRPAVMYPSTVKLPGSAEVVAPWPTLDGSWSVFLYTSKNWLALTVESGCTPTATMPSVYVGQLPAGTFSGV